jgi:hypothetical protein
MRGDPLQGLGGGGVGVSPRQTLLMPPFHAILYSMQHTVCCRSRKVQHVHSNSAVG